jgi:hypothetical protein
VFDLLCEAVVRHAEDVLELVVPRDRDITSVWFEVNRPRYAKFLVSYGEIEREIFWISWVVLQEYEALV